MAKVNMMEMDKEEEEEEIYQFRTNVFVMLKSFSHVESFVI